MLFIITISAFLVAGGINATRYWPVTSAGKGKGTSDQTTSVELLLMDPQSGRVAKSCNLPDMPEKRREHTVDGNMVCGGFSLNSTEIDNCIILTEGEWKETDKLTTQRSGHSSWQVCEGVVLLGGLGGTDTAELVEGKTGKTKKLFDLKYGFR